MLSEMNDKLSQAVKLYDKLLTEQVSHPTWTRSPPPAQSAVYQPVSPGYTYQASNGARGHWAPLQQQPQAQVQPMSPGYQQYGEPVHTPQQTHSSQAAYFNPVSTPDYQGQYPPRRESLYAAQHAPSAPLPAETQPQWTQPPQQSESPQRSYSQSAQQSQQPQQLYGQPLQHSELPQVSAQPPPTPQYNHQPPSLVAQSPAPYHPATLTTIPQSPSAAPISHLQQSVLSQPAVHPQPSPAAPPASSSGLTRHNTTSYTSSRPQHSANTFLSRHNTVTAASPPQIEHQPQQQQPALPQFPVAPTSAPQSFSLYGPSIPTNVPQPERKEALLIDL
jgi:growth factor-regulated tyrosine kinase substrate